MVHTLKDARTLLEAGSNVFLYSLDFERPGMEAIYPWHARDLTYILGIFREFQFQEYDYRLANIWLVYIRNFIKFGNPNGICKNDRKLDAETTLPEWLAVESKMKMNYMSLNVPMPKMVDHFHKNADWFWNSLVEKIESGNTVSNDDYQMDRF